MGKYVSWCLTLWDIILRSDLTPIKFIVTLGSGVWFFWALLLAFFPNSYEDHVLLFANINAQWWEAAFSAHFLVGMGILLSKNEHKRINVLVAIYGAILWSVSLNLIIASRIIVGVLPMASAAHWMMASMAWWILLRESYGK